MKIDGTDHSVSILVLCQPNEAAVTLFALNCLLRNIEPGVTISILVNGGASAGIRELAARHDCLRCYESATNLGVAGGRNFLLNTAECRAADIVMILDNDVIPPPDYVRRLCAFLLARPDAGVVGAIAADAKALSGPTTVAEARDGLAGLDSADIRRRVLEDFDTAKIFHMGVMKDFRYAYFSILPKCLQVFGYLKVFALLRLLFGIHVDINPLLKHNALHLKLLRDGAPCLEVSNVAGCSQAFRRELVDRIGLLDDRFSPYGMEDAEFCIRAIGAGRRNWVDTHTWLIHGTDDRHAARPALPSLINLYRCRTILAATLFPNPVEVRWRMLRLIVTLFVFDFLHSPVAAVRELRSRLAGYRIGLRAAGMAPS